LITGILFLVSLLLAIPTFGLSFIGFVLVKLFYDRWTAENLAKHVYLSLKNGESYDLFRVNRAAIRRLFIKYGTQTPWYDVSRAPGELCYMGTLSFAGIGKVGVFATYKGDRVTIRAVKEPEMTVENLMDGSFVRQLVHAHAQSFSGAQSKQATVEEDELPF